MSPEAPKKSGRVLATGIIGLLIFAGALFLVGRTVIRAMTYRTDAVEHGVEQAREETARVQTAVETYRERFGECPVIGEDLVTRGVIEDTPRDPWGRNLVFDCGDDHATVVSPGPDGELGTDDDVTAR